MSSGNGVSGPPQLPSATSYRQTQRCCTFPELSLSQPALPGTNCGAPGGFGVPAGCPTPLATTPQQLRAKHQGTKSTTLAVDSPYPGTQPCCHPPAPPALRHTRRGGSDGSKATKHPRVALGAQQKPQSTEPPHSLQQLTALSGDNALLRPPRAPQGGQGQPPAKGTGWHRWHSLGHPEQHKPVPQSPQGGDSSQCPGWQWNLAAGSQGGVPR